MAFAFDPKAARAARRNRAGGPATVATTATEAADALQMSQLSQLSQRPMANSATADLDPAAFTERAAIAEHDGGLDREAAERLAANEQGHADMTAFCSAVLGEIKFGLATLREDAPRGRRCIANARRFIAQGWAAKALAAGWADLELFGADPCAPWDRLDRLGVAYMPYAVKEVAADRITFAPNLTQWRGSRVDGTVAPWEANRSRPLGSPKAERGAP